MNLFKTLFHMVIGRFLLHAEGDGGGGGNDGGQGGGGSAAAVADPPAGGGDGNPPSGGGSGDGGSQGSQGSQGGQGGGNGTLFAGKGSGDGSGGSGGSDGGQGSGDGGKGTGKASPEVTSAIAKVYSGQDGAADPDAIEGLPEELEGLKPLFQKYKTEKDFIQGVKNLQFLAGRKGLEPLPDDAPESLKQEQAATLKKINRVPDTPADYKVEKPENFPEDRVPWDEKSLTPFLETLHKHNAPPELVQELVNMDAQRTAEALAEADQQTEQTFAQEREALKKEFGNDYEARMGKAERMARTLGMDLQDPIFRNHKVVVALSKAGEMVSEDRLISGDQQQGFGHDDRAKALDIVNNKSNPLYDAYHDSNHPRHDEAVRQKSELNKRWLERQKRKG